MSAGGWSAVLVQEVHGQPRTREALPLYKALHLEYMEYEARNHRKGCGRWSQEYEHRFMGCTRPTEATAPGSAHPTRGICQSFRQEGKERAGGAKQIEAAVDRISAQPGHRRGHKQTPAESIAPDVFNPKFKPDCWPGTAFIWLLEEIITEAGLARARDKQPIRAR
ncbi:hypothetical protein DFH06DRAFT_1135575 [Mycena polygramma]|nr:hypothetical protein DFH06DRAFT_1135575 [Mycena polygramma]